MPIKPALPHTLKLAASHGRLDRPWTIRGYTRDLWRAVRPDFAGLSRSRFSMAEREGLSSPLPRLRKNRRKTRIPQKPVGFCDHRRVPPIRSGGSSISIDFEAREGGRCLSRAVQIPQLFLGSGQLRQPAPAVTRRLPPAKRQSFRSSPISGHVAASRRRKRWARTGPSLLAFSRSQVTHSMPNAQTTAAS
ncbi:hypothetical protein JOE51_004189 [Bradyrhizobium japonicum]|nr:hypothetical protein [Bradyrhizobium japonicum]